MATHPDAGEPGSALHVVVRRQLLRSRRRFRRRTKLAAANAAVVVFVLLVLMFLNWLVYSSPLPTWAKIALSIVLSGVGLGGVTFEVDSDADSSH